MSLFLSFTLFLMLLGVFVISKKTISRKNAQGIFMVVSFMGMLIISGCRGLNVGNDTFMYIRYFSPLRGFVDINYMAKRFEVGFRFINCAIAQFTHDPHHLLILTSLAILLMVFITAAKESAAPWYSVLMFLLLMFYYSSMCIMRQYLAMGVTMIAFNRLKHGEKLTFIVLEVIATLIHSSAVVGFIIMPLMMIQLTPRKSILLIIASIVVALLFERLLGLFFRLVPRFATYMNSEKYYQENKLGTWINVLIWFILFLVVNHSFQHFPDHTNGEKIEYLCALLSFSIQLAAVQGAVISRITSYFALMFIVSVPNALNKIHNRKNKYTLATGVICMAFLYNMIVLIFRPYWTGVLPYTFWG